MAGLKLALLALIAVASSQEYELPQQETAFDDEFHDVPPPIRPPVAAKRIIKIATGAVGARGAAQLQPQPDGAAPSRGRGGRWSVRRCDRRLHRASHSEHGAAAHA